MLRALCVTDCYSVTIPSPTQDACSFDRFVSSLWSSLWLLLCKSFIGDHLQTVSRRTSSRSRSARNARSTCSQSLSFSGPVGSLSLFEFFWEILLSLKKKQLTHVTYYHLIVTHVLSFPSSSSSQVQSAFHS